MPRTEVLAAVDLGSNSFHLQVGRAVDGQIYALDSLREGVRLGAGLTADKRLDRATQARALEALSRFGERLRGLPRQAVRAVGTNTLRVAKNAPQFLKEARAALGFPIEVISGREEARLIYVGVAHSLPPAPHSRLVVDVGGGSTEFVIGTGFESRLTESLYMGCVSWSLRYFEGGRIDKARMKAAELAARQELSSMVRAYRAQGWQEAVGSSGTSRAIETILAESGFAASGITRDGLDRLRSLLIKHERADPDRIAGLGENRVAVLPGGVAILGAVMQELAIERLTVSDGALRHGVLYDLLGRVQHKDMREATVTQFMRRYHVDPQQAERVRRLALAIYDAMAQDAERESDWAREDDADRLLLDWSARLSEIGFSIAHAQYHRHSAYVLSNADMPGFSRMEQQRLARLVLAHRGKLGKLEDLAVESDEWANILALRLATLFLRSRTDVKVPMLRVTADEGGYTVALPQAWLDENPLTADALDSETGHWKAIGMRLVVEGLSDRKVAAFGRG